MRIIKPPFEMDLYLAGCFHFVGREQLYEILGAPVYVETDSHATYGGQEDWWVIQIDSGEFIGLCLRVPYQDAVIYCSRDSKASAEAYYSKLSQYWAYESYPELYPL